MFMTLLTIVVMILSTALFISFIGFCLISFTTKRLGIITKSNKTELREDASFETKIQFEIINSCVAFFIGLGQFLVLFFSILYILFFDNYEFYYFVLIAIFSSAFCVGLMFGKFFRAVNNKEYFLFLAKDAIKNLKEKDNKKSHRNA